MLERRAQEPDDEEVEVPPPLYRREEEDSEDEESGAEEMDIGMVHNLHHHIGKDDDVPELCFYCECNDDEDSDAEEEFDDGCLK